MKRLLRIFELTKNEQRVVLIMMLVLLGVAFVEYQRRLHRPQLQVRSEAEANPSPGPVQTEDER
jgi:hypothetical protein